MDYYGYWETKTLKDGKQVTIWKKVDQAKVDKLGYICRLKYDCYNPKYIPVELLKRVLCNECNMTEFNNVKSILQDFNIDMIDDIDIFAARRVLHEFLKVGCKIIGCEFEELPWNIIFQNISEIYYFSKCIFEDVFAGMPKNENKEKKYNILRKSLYSTLTHAEIGHVYDITGSYVGQLSGNMLLRMWTQFQGKTSSKIIKRLLTYIVKDTTCEKVYGSRTFVTLESRKHGAAVRPLVDRVMNRYMEYGLIEPATRIRHSETGDKIYERNEGEIISGSYTPDYYDLYY